jgi:hypothetical protein
VRPERSGKLIKTIHLIGSRTHELPANPVAIIIIIIIVIQLFIIYVPSQQLQSQLQTQRSVVTDNRLQTAGKS